ncbi:MAG: STAS domain-containing protein [bacterium]|nr:STAS domain-containing protein [bacterium]
MMTFLDYPTFDYDPNALEELEAASLAAIEAGAGQVVFNLDRLERLDTAGVRGLIAILRRTREKGGELALRASRPEILRSLEVTALDRVFTMVKAA